MKRHGLVYVMMDNSKVGLQEGKRGRGAPKLKTLRKLAQQTRRKAVQKAKRCKAGPAPVPPSQGRRMTNGTQLKLRPSAPRHPRRRGGSKGRVRWVA
jgi:hypothetical protein